MKSIDNPVSNRIKRIILLLCIIGALPVSPVHGKNPGNWKEAVAGYFKKAHDYESTAAYLEKRLETIADQEKPAAIILLCFSYKALGNAVGEEKWLARYFKVHETAEPDFRFLNRSDQVKLYEYLGGWKRMYPGIRSVAIHKDCERTRYFMAPERFKLDIHTRAPCGLEVFTTGKLRETLYSGYLEEGKNTVGLAFKKRLKQDNETGLELVLKSGSIRVKHPLTLTAAFQFPAHVTFDPQTGQIVITGEQFKKEKTEETIFETRKYFDKTYFFKKAVPYLAVGAGVLVVDRLAIYPASTRQSASPNSRAFMNGLDKTALVMGAGISLKGVVHLFKSFKKEKKARKRTVVHQDAIQFNNQLKSRIVEAEKDVFVVFNLKDNRADDKDD